MNIPPQPKINHTTSTYLWKNISFTINLHVGVTFLIFFVKLMCSDWVLKKKSCCLHLRETANRHLTPSKSLFCPKGVCISPDCFIISHTECEGQFPKYVLLEFLLRHITFHISAAAALVDHPHYSPVTPSPHSQIHSFFFIFLSFFILVLGGKNEIILLWGPRAVL